MYAELALPSATTALLLVDLQEEHRGDPRFLVAGYDVALANARRLNRAQLANLAAEPVATGRTHLRVRIGQRLELIALADVFYFQADQKYITVRHRHGQALIEDSLKTLETELGTRAVRVHRNALAMTAQIAGLEKTADGGVLIFHDIPDRLEVSRRHLTVVRQCLRNL